MLSLYVFAAVCAVAFVGMAGHTLDRFLAAWGLGGTAVTFTAIHWNPDHGCVGVFSTGPASSLPDGVILVRDPPKAHGVSEEECVRDAKVPGRLVEGDGGGWFGADDEYQVFTSSGIGRESWKVWPSWALVTALSGLPLHLLALSAGLRRPED
ncbi:hypothetical protein ACFQ07_15110, partial [Actinomadura adrarensis]